MLVLLRGLTSRRRARVRTAALALAIAACGRGPTPAAPPAPVPGTVDSAAAVWSPELDARRLMVPVDGVAPDRVPDTFDAARDGARVHHASDILAPRGTPVLAADDGTVLAVRSNTLGGLTVYAVDPDRRFVYYYAHLERYREGLTDGMPIVKGEVLGYVGTTGNAPPDTPHLHFQVMRWPADGKWWKGVAIDARPHFVLEGHRR